MFSWLLLHSESDTGPVVAKKCDVNVQVVGHVGRGKASAVYDLDRGYNNLVLYVPSLIAHRGAIRQQVRLRDCQVQVQSDSDSKVRNHSFRLSRVDHSPNSVAQALPELASLKQSYKDLISAYCGACSSEDIVLHLDDLSSGCKLSVQFDFLVQFYLTSATSMQYLVHNKLPAKHLSYSLNLASSLPVEEVLPMCTGDTPNGKLGNLKWDLQDENIVHVAYEYVSTNSGMKLSPYSSGFVMKLREGIAAGCCLSLMPTSTPTTSSQYQYDGVLMLNSTITRAQLPSHLQEKPLFPSEFVFVIDCSGSMSGTNIQSAADTLITCIKSLPNDCYFNVVAFGSTFRQLFHTSTEYTKKSVERVVQFANQLQASLGGTELLAPLRWIFKSPRCNSLPCQVFIITDGGVTNTQSVLHTVRKNRHQARCHTFGIGSEVCLQLVTGIAASSGGRCVLLEDGERLQTKVMEVLKESLQPLVSNTVIRWNPPAGYSVVDTTPRNPGTLYSGSNYTAFAFLQKTDDNATVARHSPSLEASATIFGKAGGEDVELRVTQTVLPSLTVSQSVELWSILNQSSLWSKLTNLETQALSSSRKNSHDENDKLEPSPKRPRLNGMTSSVSVTTTGEKIPGKEEIREQLIELSLKSGIPCSLTYFTGCSGNSRISQITSRQQNLTPTPKKIHLTNSKTFRYYNQQKRRRPHSYFQKEAPPTQFSVTSLAKNSINAVGSTLKTVANLATFGLLGQETTPHLENGQRIEDELAYQQNKDSQLHWDESRGQLVYPSFYYVTQPGSENTSSNPTKHKKSGKNRKHTSSSQNHALKLGPFPPVNGTSQNHVHISLPNLSAQHDVQIPNFIVGPMAEMSTDHSAGEEDEFTISDSESDSSVDPDWEDLRRPNELLPLIHMQLFSGAWPIVRAFSYAVGVPLEEIRKLPVKTKPHTTPNSSCMTPSSDSLPTSDVTDENKAHFWTTALAIACLEEYFVHLRTEWELVAHKGHCWLEKNLHQTDLSIGEVQRITRELVLRQS